jgi:hydroxypyruvate isomerase
VPRFAANISLLYPEWPLLDRIAAAARDGFAAVEVQFPYEVPATEFRRALADARVQAVLLNTPPAADGQRGVAALPGREAEFAAGLAQAIDYARTIGAARLHVMAGAPHASDDAAITYERNLVQAVCACAPHGLTPLIEPLNPRDAPGYFLDSLPRALDTIARVPGVRLQFDAYHVQILHGDVTRWLDAAWPAIGHVQVAGAPDRHEPDRGELALPRFCAELDRRGYAGWVGAEYRPADARPGGTSAGLGWLRRV